MTAARRVGAGLAAALGLAALAGLSRVPYAAAPADATLRLAWRARSERVEECRRLDPEERARLPVHMRRDSVCEGRFLPYRLVVRVDDRALVDAPIRAAGAREDRPVYVFQEFRLPPGPHRLVVDFARERPPGPVAPAGGFPAVLALDTTVVLAPRQAALVTYDADRRGLVVLTGPRSPG